MTPFQTSNPALATDSSNPFAFRDAGAMEAITQTATMAGVIQKTTFLVTLAMAAGVGGFMVFKAYPATLWVGSIAAFVITLGIFFVMRGNPMRAIWLAPLYALVQGALLGGVTGIMEQLLIARLGTSVPGGLAFQALVVTGGAMGATLILYRAGILRPTQRFKAVLGAATLGIMITYLISFALSFFGISMPFISLASTMESGTVGLIGLGLNLVILVIASLTLVTDFGMIEDQVNAGAPKRMEWYCGFALLVTLAWIYFEAVKLIVRLAMIFGRRN